MIPIAKKKKPINNFKMAMGFGYDWIDLDSGIIYKLEEYKKALEDPDIPKDKKPKLIRMVSAATGEDVGWADEYTVAEKMKDPKPDPKYAPETLSEHRRNW